MTAPYRKKSHLTLLYLILGVELSFTIISLLFGAHGLPALQNLKQERTIVQESIEKLSTDIKQLQENINRWQDSTFYREQLAREQLQMAYADDIVYYVTK